VCLGNLTLADFSVFANMLSTFRVGVYVLVIVILCSPVIDARNEEIAPNIVGRTAQVCAAHLCPQHNGLDLWLDIHRICYPDNSVKSLELVLLQQLEEVRRQAANAAAHNDSGAHFTPHKIGVLAGFLSIVGLVSGFFAGETHNRQSMMPTAKFSVYSTATSKDFDRVYKVAL
jgi:hypothetical protein